MPQNFMLFSELQKKVSPSPIKTWRLLARMRAEGRMKEGEDFIMTDRKLYVNVPRFVVEMEHLGYNVKSDDFKNGNVISDDFKKLYDEMRLISDEITNSRIQEEMKSTDITSTLQLPEMKSVEIKNEEPPKKSDGISATTISPEINLKSPEFNMLLRSKDEIIESKKEQIRDMQEMYTKILESKDSMLKSKDDELKEVRGALETVVQQNKTLVHQNVYLTRLLTAPKEDHAEHQQDDVISGDFTDITEAGPEYETPAQEPESEAMASRETGMRAENVPADRRTSREVPTGSDQSDRDQNTPEASSASV